MLKPASALDKDQRTANYRGADSLQHRHFAFIADVLRNLVDTYDQPLQKSDVIEAFADACAHTNPKFDRKRFLAACSK